MEDKCENKSNTSANEPVPSEDKNIGKISTSTTTTSLSTEDEQESQEVISETIKKIEKPKNMSPGAVKLRSWLNQLLRITMSDGRVLIGMFFCTDRDANIILGGCSEYLPEEVDANGAAVKETEEPRILGLVMVPGKHIVNISVDQSEEATKSWSTMNQPLTNEFTMQDDVM